MSLSEFIKNDLLFRLSSGQSVPPKITLEAVADMYQVSTTPVRRAINELVAEGLLQKGDNRRLTFVGERIQSVVREPNHGLTPSTPLLELMTRELVRLSLNGRPIWLREQATAGKYHVSRAAIRTVFQRLAGSGILMHEPRRGWVLRPFRLEDMESFLEMRIVLELKALEVARPYLAETELKRILDGNQLPESESHLPQVDNSLHAYIIEKSGNPYIKDFFKRHGQYYEILFNWEDLDQKAARDSVREHREILELMLQQDWSAAGEALAQHIQHNHPVIKRVLSNCAG